MTRKVTGTKIQNAGFPCLSFFFSSFVIFRSHFPVSGTDWVLLNRERAYK